MRPGAGVHIPADPVLVLSGLADIDVPGFYINLPFGAVVLFVLLFITLPEYNRRGSDAVAPGSDRLCFFYGLFNRNSHGSEVGWLKVSMGQ